MKAVLWSVVGAVFLYGAALRVVYPTSDDRFENAYGFGTSTVDDVIYHSARVWLLNQGHIADDWMHTYIMGPIPNGLMFVIGKIFGPSHETLRLPCMLAGVATVGFLLGVAASYARPWTLLFVALCSMANVGLIAHTRAAYLEPFLMLLQAFLYWLVIRMRHKPKIAFWIGLLCVLGLGVKPSSILFTIPVLALSALWVWAEPDATRTASARQLLKGVLLGCFAYGLFILFNWQRWPRLFLAYSATRTFIKNTEHWISFIGLPTGPGQRNLGLFTFMPYLDLAALWGFFYFMVSGQLNTLFPSFSDIRQKAARQLYSDRLRSFLQSKDRQGFLDLCVFWFFVGGILTHLILNVDLSTHRLAHLLPPLVLFGARGLAGLVEPADSKAPDRRHWGPVALGLSFVVSWFCLKAIVFAFLGVDESPVPMIPGQIKDVFTHTSRQRFLLSGQFEIGLALVGFLLFQMKDLRRWVTPSKKFFWAIVPLVGLLVVNDTRLYWNVMREPTYYYYQLGKKVDALCDPEKKCFILGIAALSLEWVGNFYPLFYYPGIGIGYKRTTIALLDRIIRERDVRYFVAIDLSKKVLTPGSTYDWKYGNLGAMSLEEFKKLSPIILDFNKIVTTSPLLDDMALPGGQLVVLERK